LHLLMTMKIPQNGNVCGQSHLSCHQLMATFEEDNWIHSLSVYVILQSWLWEGHYWGHYLHLLEQLNSGSGSVFQQEGAPHHFSLQSALSWRMDEIIRGQAPMKPWPSTSCLCGICEVHCLCCRNLWLRPFNEVYRRVPGLLLL
jgi:hypothetical protein